MKRNDKPRSIRSISVVAFIVSLTVFSITFINQSQLLKKHFVHINDNERLLVIDEYGIPKFWDKKGLLYIPSGSTYHVWQKYIQVNCIN